MVSQQKNVIAGFLFAVFLVTLFSSSFLGQLDATSPPAPLERDNQVSTTHAPIAINGDSDPAWSTFGGGDGSSPGQAVLISNYEISASNVQLISIINTEKYFIIQGCSLDGLGFNGHDSIYLRNVKNGRILSNTVYRSQHAIVVTTGCENIEISYNTAHETGEYMGNGGGSGILVNDSADIVIHNNTMYDHAYNGIWVTDTTNCSITNNEVYSCETGIWSINSGSDIEITGNTVYDMRCTAIRVGAPSTVTSNTVYDSEYGILALNTTVAVDNIIYKNDIGILVENSDISNEFTGNTLYDNGLGIYLLGDDAQVLDNSIWGSTIGICTDGSSGNIIQGNEIFHAGLSNNCDYGVKLANGSSANYVRNNTIIACVSYGVHIGSGDSGNDVKWNTFIKNNPEGTSQCYTDNAGNPITLNFYNEWITPDILPADGIVDDEYVWDTSIVEPAPYDPTPLTTPPTDVEVHFVAQVEVIYPNGGELINETATIDWTDTLDTLNHEVTYDLFYTSTGVSDWESLGEDLTESSYFWDTTSYAEYSDYLIKVIATCSEGNFTEDVSDALFTVQGHTLSTPNIQNPLAGDTAFQTVEISWAPAVDTWGHSVTYTLSFSNNSGGDWYVLGSDLSVTTYLWDTTTLTEGDNFLLKVVATCSEGIIIEAQTLGTFSVHQHALTRPSLQYPNGGELINESALIQWSASTDTLGYDVYYDVEYSPDNGESWISLGTDLETNSLEWDTTLVTKGSSFLVRVTANSAGGPTTDDTSNDVFVLQAHSLNNPIISNPVGGAIYKDSIEIQWTESFSSWGYDVTYSVFFTFDGVNWIRLVSDTNETSYAWNIASIADGTDYGVKVIALCDTGLTSFSTTPSFTIQNQELVTTTTTTTTTTTATITNTTTTSGLTNTSVAELIEYDALLTVGATAGAGVAIVLVIFICLKTKPDE